MSAFLFFVLTTLSSAEIIEHVVAIVNEEIVTESDVEKLHKKLETGGLVDDALLRLNDPKALLKDRKNLVDYMIDEKIMDSEVKKKNLSATVEQVEQEIRNISTQKNVTRAQLKQALQENGVVFSEYQDFIRTSLERHSLIDREVRGKIKVSEEDLGAAYSAQKGKGPEKINEYTIAHILFLPQKKGEADAKARAEKVQKRIKAREMSFEKLVANYSDDTSESSDGLFGTFRSGEMTPEMNAAISNLKVGETSQIVKTKAGFHIFKLVAKNQIANPEYEKEKEQLFNSLMTDAFKKQFRMWLTQKRRDAFIKVNEG